MARNIKTFYIDPETRTARVKEIPDNLDSFYELLHCDCIDIPTRKIGGTYYDIICDDEGLLKDAPYISAIDPERNVMLVGALLVCGRPDGEGNLTSLTDDDIANIKRNLRMLGSNVHPIPYPMLTNVEY